MNNYRLLYFSVVLLVLNLSSCMLSHKGNSFTSMFDPGRIHKSRLTAFKELPFKWRKVSEYKLLKKSSKKIFSFIEKEKKVQFVLFEVDTLHLIDSYLTESLSHRVIIWSKNGYVEYAYKNNALIILHLEESAFANNKKENARFPEKLLQYLSKVSLNDDFPEGYPATGRSNSGRAVYSRVTVDKNLKEFKIQSKAFPMW